MTVSRPFEATRQRTKDGNAAAAIPGTGGGLTWPITAFTLMVASWLFDFKSAGAGEAVAIQLTFLASFVFFFLIFLISEQSDRAMAPGLGVLITATFLFAVVGVASGILNGQDFYPVFRSCFNLAIYLAAAYASSRVFDRANAALIRKILSFLVCGYLVTTPVIVFLREGINFEKVRFQILGTSIIPAFGYLGCLLLFRLRSAELGAAIAAPALVFISITRTFLLIFAFQVMPVANRVRTLLTPRMIVFALAVAGLGIGMMLYGEVGLGRWEERMAAQDSYFADDYTLATRLSEWDYMWKAFSGSASQFAIGNGIAAQTVWYNPKEIGGGAEFSVGFGHNQHLSLLFIAGIVGGLPLLIVHFVQFFQAQRLLHRMTSLNAIDSDVLFLGAWGAMIMIGVVVGNFLSAAFFDRGPTMWYGIGTGLFLGMRAVLAGEQGQAAMTAPEDEAAPRQAPGGPYLPPAVARRRLALEQARQQSQG